MKPRHGLLQFRKFVVLHNLLDRELSCCSTETRESCELRSKENDMNLKLKVVIIVLLAIPYAAFGLNCHKCSSTKSWEECDDKKSSKVTCAGNDATCYKVHYSTEDKTIQVFANSCGPKTYCTKTANPVCKVHLGASDCKISCCEEDMCNAASRAGLSGLVMLSGVLVAALCS